MEGYSIFTVYKSLFLVIFFTLLCNIAAKPCMFFSTPHSGIVWFLSEYQKKADCNKIAYHYSDVIARYNNTYYDTQSLFDSLNKQVVKQNALLFTEKNNYTIANNNSVFFDLNFFSDYFYPIIFYCHRRFMFPLNHDGFYYVMAYQLFLQASLKDACLQDLQLFCRSHFYSKKEQQVVAHVIMNYMLLKQAQLYDYPVIEYEKIMKLSDKKLNYYLQVNMPFLKRVKQWTNNLVLTRKKWTYFVKTEPIISVFYYLFSYFFQSKNWIDFKQEAYQKENLEKTIQELIIFLKKRDTTFNGWHYLE